MELIRVRHNWPEPAGFQLDRPNGAGDAIFLHFLTPARLDFGGEERDVPEGSMILFRPDTPHAISCRQKLLHNWMHLSRDAEQVFLRFGMEADRLYRIPQGDAVTSRIYRLETEFFARASHREEAVQCLLGELLVNLSRQLEGQVQPDLERETADRLRSLRAEMVLNPDCSWTNEKMARYLNVSGSRLYPLYRRMFSISPGRDLILMRVERAKQLLLRHSVARTAELLGYGSTFHFIRQFRGETGMTPGQWSRK